MTDQQVGNANRRQEQDHRCPGNDVIEEENLVYFRVESQTVTAAVIGFRILFQEAHRDRIDQRVEGCVIRIAQPDQRNAGVFLVVILARFVDLPDGQRADDLRCVLVTTGDFAGDLRLVHAFCM